MANAKLVCLQHIIRLDPTVLRSRTFHPDGSQCETVAADREYDASIRLFQMMRGRHDATNPTVERTRLRVSLTYLRSTKYYEVDHRVMSMRQGVLRGYRHSA
jgi:hypothetical protein